MSVWVLSVDFKDVQLLTAPSSTAPYSFTFYLQLSPACSPDELRFSSFVLFSLTVVSNALIRPSGEKSKWGFFVVVCFFLLFFPISFFPHRSNKSTDG